MRPVSRHSNTPSIDGNYVFSPPKDDTAPPEQTDRPRLRPLDVSFQNDGKVICYVSHKISVKEAHKAQNLTTIDSAMAELNAAWTAASQDIYNTGQQGGQQQPAGDGQPGSGGQTADAGAGDNVTDVPYEEVK